jgi:type IV pilus assembly protein PilC
MQRFTYQIRDGSGASQTGALTAGDLAEASRMLRRDGKTIVSLAVDAEASVQPQGFSFGGKRKVKRDDVIFFATQLAVMVDTGVPIAEALDCIAQGADNIALKETVTDLSNQVKSGVEFSKALESYPKVFNRLFVALMRASEASGTMGTMLQRLSEYLEQDRDTRKKVKGAMTYPVCMLSFCILVVIGLLVFVLPRFEKIYAGKGAVLPLPTRILLGLSGGIVHYWPIILAVVGATVAGIYFFARSPAGKIFFDDLRLRLPVIGPMTRKACLVRSLRTMATMVTTGVSILDGLQLTAEVAGNYFYSKMWTDIGKGAEEGMGLSQQLTGYNLVPAPITQIIAAGERTGQLGPVMNRAAGFCENDLRIAIKTSTDMIEPIMIVVMGAIVGGIAMSLLLPIFSISRVMAH